MMRIGRRSDPSMPVQPEEMYGNQVDYSRFFRPNGFF
ncbi:hypothetical protein M3Y94_00979000 [Aphelenchoides besseyi]|nr:hypothetical protein M3Y94_00979000 [Aphelenchoides besseyi]